MLWEGNEIGTKVHRQILSSENTMRMVSLPSMRETIIVVLGLSLEAKVKWLKLMVVAKEFKEVEPEYTIINNNLC
jgi:hypothetical protein